MKKKKDETILEEIAGIIGKFLMAHGGLGNGFNTYAKGSVSIQTAGCLEIFTPDCDDLTYNQVSRLGNELERKIQIYMTKEKFQRNESIIVSVNDMEHGACETTVEMIKTERVILY